MNPFPPDQGSLAVITATNPGAGFDWTLTIPVRNRIKLISLGFKLAADLNAANRYISLTIENQTSDIFLYTHSSATVTAAQTWWFALMPAAGTFFSSNSFISTLTAPAELILDPNYVIRCQTLNMQAGDNYTDIHLLCETWVMEL